MQAKATTSETKRCCCTNGMKTMYSQTDASPFNLPQTVVDQISQDQLAQLFNNVEICAPCDSTCGSAAQTWVDAVAKAAVKTENKGSS